jgi:Na+/H+ antiporter
MLLLELLTLLLLTAVFLTWVARQLRIPYPIVLVIGGAALGFVPGLPPMPFAPSVLLAAVLPPILFDAAYQISFRDFKRQRRAIGLLAIGLVVATTLGMGLTLKWLLPEIPWAVAFAFGAVVSPPDAVTATAIMSRLNVPRALATTLKGESLLNDASGLVLYKFALAAALTGAFSMTAAFVSFLVVAIGGVIVGIVVGVLREKIDRRLKDTPVMIVFSFIVPYVAYLTSEQLGVSGVLAVVTAGLIGARAASTAFNAEQRIMGRSTWEVAVILLNSLVFILMGSQLSVSLAVIPHRDLWQLLGYAGILGIAAIAIRMIWVFPGAYVPRMMDRWRGKKHVQFPPWQNIVVLGWCGMRGIVSVAAVLALPLNLPDSSPFPRRDLIIFLTFMVTLITLVVPGLTLATLMQRLKVGGSAEEKEEMRLAREQIARAALRKIAELHSDGMLSDEIASHLKRDYEARLVYAQPYALLQTPASDPYYIGRQEALAAERHRLLELSRAEVIDDQVLHVIERELDHEEARITLDAAPGPL